MTDRKRIALFVRTLWPGGVEHVRLILAEEFLRRGYGVDLVVIRAEGDLLDRVPDGVRLIDLDAPHYRAVLAKTRRYLRDTPPAAVLVAMYPLTVVVALAAKLARFPGAVVVSEHTDFRVASWVSLSDRVLMKTVFRWVYSTTAKVVAVSQGVADSLHTVVGLPRSKLAVIHNPVRADLPEPISPDEREELRDWLEAEHRLIAIGSLKEAKSYDVLLEAFAALDPALNSRLLILGEGPLRSELEARARALGITERVSMPGYRPNPLSYLAHADGFVMSSSWEGLGNVIVEALRMGVPVVSTDCPSGPSEILEGGRHGTLVPVRDPGRMAAAIADMLRATHDTDALKRRAEDFSPERQGGLYLQLMGLDADVMP